MVTARAAMFLVVATVAMSMVYGLNVCQFDLPSLQVALYPLLLRRTASPVKISHNQTLPGVLDLAISPSDTSTSTSLRLTGVALAVTDTRQPFGRTVGTWHYIPKTVLKPSEECQDVLTEVSEGGVGMPVNVRWVRDGRVKGDGEGTTGMGEVRIQVVAVMSDGKWGLGPEVTAEVMELGAEEPGLSSETAEPDHGWASVESQESRRRVAFLLGLLLAWL